MLGNNIFLLEYIHSPNIGCYGRKNITKQSGNTHRRTPVSGNQWSITNAKLLVTLKQPCILY